METARKRILYFIENQKIKGSDFLEKTNLKKGFLDKSHAESGASDIHLSKILESYSELSAEWLLTGKGQMLKKNKNESLNEEKNTIKEGLNSSIELLNKEIENVSNLLASKQETIETQKELINNLKTEIERLNTEIELTRKSNL